MNALSKVPQRKLKYAATINNEALGEETDDDYELQYVDIGNVDSSGTIHEITTYRFADAPSRARKRVRNGDIIISCVRTYLQAISPIQNPPDNLIVSTGFAVVRPREGILDSSFGKYAVREASFLAEVEMRSVGVSYPAINASDLGDIPIHLPPPHTQRTIADYLDRETARLDALVAAKERVLGLLAEKRRALITRAVTRGLDPRAPLRDSGIPWLGKIPVHWVAFRLKYLSKEPLAYGANESAADDDPSHPRFVRITDINDDGNLREDTFRSLPPETAAPYLLKNQDILFARSGATVGKVFMYQSSWGTACFAGYLIRLHCDSKVVLPGFVYAFAQSEPYWGQIGEGTIQATIQNFSAEKYGELEIAIPPLKEQQQIVAFIEEQSEHLESVRSSTVRTISLLKERRAALIAAVVTGQIQVKMPA